MEVAIGEVKLLTIVDDISIGTAVILRVLSLFNNCAIFIKTLHADSGCKVEIGGDLLSNKCTNLFVVLRRWSPMFTSGIVIYQGTNITVYDTTSLQVRGM